VRASLCLFDLDIEVDDELDLLDVGFNMLVFVE
jgi:hypothetical protein